MTIRVGDLVQRRDKTGAGSGVLYRVISVGEPYLQRTYGPAQVPVKVRSCRLQAALVMFESREPAPRRHAIRCLDTQLVHVDLVLMGSEWAKLSNLIRDEVARRSGKPVQEVQ